MNRSRNWTIYRHTLTTLSNQAWTLFATERGLCRILFPHDSPLSADHWLHRHAPGYRLVEERGPFTEFGVLDLLERYFAGEPVSFDPVPADLWGTAFQQQVWQALRSIPYGETWTYRQLAEWIGNPAASRAVGTANGRNPLPVIVPCHRVVGTNGTLTGYRGGLRIKEELLALEGVRHLEATGHERFRF